VPLAVKFVVLAPPFIERRPLVMVEEAFERKPLVKVARPVWRVELRVRVFPVRAPIVAVCEKRFVLLAIVEKRAVVVAPPCPMENTVVDAFVTASKRLPVPHAVSLLYGEVVPMPRLPNAFQIPELGKYAFPDTVSAVVLAYVIVALVEVILPPLFARNAYLSPRTPPVVLLKVIVTPLLRVCAVAVIGTNVADQLVSEEHPRTPLFHLNVLGEPVPSIVIQ
jgi:hypothetical protein